MKGSHVIGVEVLILVLMEYGLRPLYDHLMSLSHQAS